MNNSLPLRKVWPLSGKSLALIADWNYLASMIETWRHAPRCGWFLELMTLLEWGLPLHQTCHHSGLSPLVHGLESVIMKEGLKFINAHGKVLFKVLSVLLVSTPTNQN